MNKTIIYTDGSSRGNPGPGGWGAIVISNNNVQELGGREDHTTNNRMELTGAIEALRFVNSNDLNDLNNSQNQVTLYSDSQYVIKGMTEWIQGWIQKGWRNSQKKDVLNRDLWEKLLEASKDKNIEWKYVKGHADNAGNTRCDEIATSFADNENMKLYKGSIKSYQQDILKG